MLHTNQKDIVGNLPRELSVKVLGFLRGTCPLRPGILYTSSYRTDIETSPPTAPKTLARCALVNKAWYSAANDELIWKTLCHLRWSSKKNIEPQLHPRVDYTSLVPTLSVREIKEILKARKVDIRGLFDKSDLVKALLSSLPIHSPPQQGIRWSSHWKASFIIAELDAKRTILTKDELCNIEWEFRMKHWPEDVKSHAKFNTDYSYKSAMFQGEHSMKWRFYANDVQVEQYPALSISREKDWGVVMQNDMAIFHQPA
ncbi:hypothetical protein HDU77_005275 [Chytriomyces hyalinus]|nr:hypothetical protein HDU77_005275 [Chytriomyces hyalinus]